MNKSVNVRQLLINEISLEGLDGITLQALWIRISEATQTILPYPERLEAEYWKNICQLPYFEFYELETPRPELVPFKRFSGTLEDPVPLEKYPEDIYPHKLVNDTDKGICGSCTSYKTRHNITEVAKNTDYIEATNKWGSTLVIVASQDLRNRALMGECNKVELTPIQYCILERIGRSRYQGEITQGKRSLQAVGEDPKSLFYHRKTLLKHKFITKQFYHVKSGSENCSGSLLHLTRFYVEIKSKYLLLTEKAVEYLKTKPNFRAEYSDLKKHLNLNDAARKVFKFADFQRFIQTDVKLPYRELYPDSTPAEWKQKNFDKEKSVRVLQLIDPDVDVAENWYSRHGNDDQGDEDDDELGFKNYENLCIGKSVLAQGAAIVRRYGENGITQSELGQTIGLGKLNTRSLCRSLLRKNVVTCIMHDVGRQRVTRFVSRKFESKGQMTRQFKEERERMMSLLSSQKTEENDPKQQVQEPVTLVNVNDGNSNNKKILTSTLADPIPSTSKDYSNYEQDDSIISNVHVDVHVDDDDSIIQLNKKIKLNIEDDSRKRKILLPDANEPSAKVAKIRADQRDIQENMDKIVVEISVTKHDSKLKGYSQGFEDQIQSEMLNSKMFKATGGSLTYRILKRANFIIECIRQYKVVADLQKLMKMIQEVEQDEGYLVKIDKKSLVRLLLKLAKEGHVKYMKATLTHNDRTKTIAFVCDPSIEEGHSLIQSEIEQAKMKFFIGYSKKGEKGKMKRVKKVYTFDKKIAKELGFCPKFVRMRLAHELLFYLVYEQRRDDQPITTFEGKREWCHQMQLKVDDALVHEMCPIYFKRELCWKTFIPPLPVHIGWPEGWTLVCDVLVRLPFRTFMQCCSATHNVEGVKEYVNHPVRKFYLIRDLPLNLRNDLLYKRKYIFQMHGIISRLCYIGLVQFGPQKFKEKDQVFVYINKKSTILNTTTSKQGYHEISPEVYDKHEYTFDSFSDIEQYWYDLWRTCMNTRLGGRSCVTGKYVLIEQLETKPAMVEALAPISPELAASRDDGSVPGNSRGAAGLDSAIFAHLKRNWSWNSASQVFEQTPKPPRNPKKKRVVETIKIPDPNNQSEMMEIEVKKQMVANTKQLNKTASSKTVATKVKRVIVKPKSVIRKVQAKTQPKRKPLYDEIDKMALAKMYKLRTDWTLVEDHILLLCNIASQYLFPNRRKQMISVPVYRDILHKLSATSTSKTSRACQRRILYTMKNINTRRSVNMCLEEIRQNENIKAKYQEFISRLQKGNIPELELNVTFIDLVCQLMVIFSNMMKSSNNRRSHILLPSTVQDFHDKFHICVTPKKLKHSYNEPKTTDDIDFNVVKTVVHSSMCCTKDKTSWAYQLFKIYQQYPEHLLRSAVTKTRQEQLISLKKSFGIKKKSTMPLSSSPYKLSITYYNHLLTKIPYGIYQDSYELLVSLADGTQGLALEIINPGCGVPVAIMELLEKVDINFKFEIPDEIIILDQNIKKDKTYERLVERFYNILKDPSRVQKWEEQFSNNGVEDEGNFPQIEQTDEVIKKNPDAPLSVSRHVTTRIAFHIMRAEICEGLDDISTQHLHDFFVVNACRVWINIPSITNTSKNIDIEDFCEEYKEVKTVLTPQLLSSIKNNAILPIECPTHEQIIEYIKRNNGNEYDINMAETLLQYIESCNLFGATLSELKSMLIVKHEGNIAALEILQLLEGTRIIIKTGIEKVRYVHFNYKKHWIINSYKILRLEREKIPPITCPSKEEIQDHMRKHKQNFSYHELQKSKLRLDLNSQQEIKVLISPWIRIDGSLNRRVLDRWLGTVLIQLLEKPGSSLHAVTQKFHYMKPIDVITMIHYLMTLKCVKQYTLHKTKTTLFSGIPTMNLVPATGLEDPKDILLEPYYDAMTKLSIFIGKKAYATDFLMNYYF